LFDVLVAAFACPPNASAPVNANVATMVFRSTYEFSHDFILISNSYIS